jgi:hypothetical protein
MIWLGRKWERRRGGGDLVEINEIICLLPVEDLGKGDWLRGKKRKKKDKRSQEDCAGQTLVYVMRVLGINLPPVEVEWIVSSEQMQISRDVEIFLSQLLLGSIIRAPKVERTQNHFMSQKIALSSYETMN